MLGILCLGLGRLDYIIKKTTVSVENDCDGIRTHNL